VEFVTYEHKIQKETDKTLNAMIRKPNLPLTVVLIIIIEGFAIYLNMWAHPKSQPGLTIFIVVLLALIFGFVVKNITGKKVDLKESGMKRNNGILKYGIGFWIGAAVYSLINMIMNLKKFAQDEILIFNYIIVGAAIFGFTLNIILLKKAQK
jgi:hypothetical protein